MQVKMGELLRFPSEREGRAYCHALLFSPSHSAKHFPSTNRDRSAGSAAGFRREQIDKASACHYLSCASGRKPCTTQMKCGNVKLKKYRRTENNASLMHQVTDKCSWESRMYKASENADMSLGEFTHYISS